MEDPILNRNLEESKELQTRWSQFHDFANMAYQQGASKITPQAEMKFLELKSRIAMLHDGFIGGVKDDVKTAQKMIAIVGDCIMLKKLALSSDGDKQKFEFDWNECYMLITETLGAMEEEKKRLAGINERAYRATKRREIWQANIHNFLHSNLLKWGASFVAIAFVIVGVPMTGIYNYFKIPDDIPALQQPYLTVTRFFVRPVLMKDLEYHGWWEVPINEKPETAGAKMGTSGVNKSNFVSTFMNKIGFAADDTKARNLIKNIREDLKAERWNIGVDVDFVGILFDTSASAKSFIEMENTDLAARSDKKSIVDMLYVQRCANLVVIGYGNHPFKDGYTRSRYNFGPNDPSLVQ